MSDEVIITTRPAKITLPRSFGQGWQYEIKLGQFSGIFNFAAQALNSVLQVFEAELYLNEYLGVSSLTIDVTSTRQLDHIQELIQRVVSAFPPKEQICIKAEGTCYLDAMVRACKGEAEVTPAMPLIAYIIRNIPMPEQHPSIQGETNIAGLLADVESGLYFASSAQ